MQELIPFVRFPKNRDGTPVMMDGLPVKMMSIREVFPCCFDEQGNPKVYPREKIPVQHIYAIRSGQSDNIKIGISHDVSARLSILQIGSPTILSVVSIWRIENAKKVERLLHKKFASLRRKGEWFFLTESALQDLTMFLKLLGAQHEKY